MEKYDRQAAAFIERAYQAPEIINQRMRTLAALGLIAGERVLDAGCGTGLLLEQQARAVGSAGYAAGVDYSDDMLDVARERLAGLDQVDLRQGSVESLDFDDAVFDAVSCTQTLLYVDDIEAALAQLYRVLKPGGRLAIIETDWRGAVFNHPHLDVTRRMFDALDHSRQNPQLARQLRPRLKSLGYASVRVEAIPLLNAGYSDNNFSAGMMENTVASARRHGYIDDAEARAWREAYDELKAADAYFFCVNRFLFTAIK
jgi:ubiquinone/menaquinone biosynthesis C-methylase UbiE